MGKEAIGDCSWRTDTRHRLASGVEYRSDIIYLTIFNLIKMFSINYTYVSSEYDS